MDRSLFAIMACECCCGLAKLLAGVDVRFLLGLRKHKWLGSGCSFNIFSVFLQYTSIPPNRL